jgi:hypothetical protein
MISFEGRVFVAHGRARLDERMLYASPENVQGVRPSVRELRQADS